MPRTMLSIATAVLSLGLAVGEARGAVVANTNVSVQAYQKARIVLVPHPGGGFDAIVVYDEAYSFTVWQDAAHTDYTGATATYTPATSTPGTTGPKQLLFGGGLTDEGVDFYLVQPGTAFGPAAQTDGTATPLYVSLHAAPPFAPPAGDFYIGLATNRGGGASPQDRNCFGWLQFTHNADGTLSMTANAMAYQSRGIVVGTTNQVPEPAGAGVVIAAAVGLRRRSRE